MNKFDFKAMLKKNGSRTVMASLLSIVIGMLAGSIIIAAVGLNNEALGVKSVWDGIRIVFLGMFTTGRNATGALTFGFNPQMMGNMLSVRSR